MPRRHRRNVTRNQNVLPTIVLRKKTNTPCDVKIEDNTVYSTSGE